MLMFLPQLLLALWWLMHQLQILFQQRNLQLHFCLHRLATSPQHMLHSVLVNGRVQSTPVLNYLKRHWGLLALEE